MAKLNRVLARIFGSGAGTDQISKFGSLAAGAAAFTTDPAEAQSLSNWLTGWFGAVIGGNAPAIEDMNSAFFVVAYQIAYLMQAGVAEWNTDTVYYIGSLVNSGGVLFVSLTDNNQGNALTDNSKWQVFNSLLVQRTASANIGLSDNFTEFDATLGACAGTLPVPSTAKGRIFTVTKTDSSANAVSVTDGTFVANLTSQNDSITVFCNGSKYYSLTQKIDSSVAAVTCNGFGSTNTKVRRWTTVTSKGTAITYSDSATLGGKFTINENGLYAVDFSDQPAGTSYIGIVQNGTQGSTSLGAGTVNGLITNTVNPASGQAGHCGTTLRLNAGDYIWCQTEGTPSGTGPWQEKFRITKIAD